MKVFGLINTSIKVRRYTISAFVIALSLLTTFAFLTGCAPENLSTHVYTSNSNSRDVKQEGLPNEYLNADQLAVGAERYSKYLPLLVGKRVSLVVNQSALVKEHSYLPPSPTYSSASEFENGEANNSSTAHSNSINANHHYQHLLDALLRRSINVVSIMSPEHGFRGNKGAGEKVHSDIDAKTGLPIHSLYGKTKKPTPAMLENIDVIVFDIQDVGVRFYTYLSTLHYVMEAAFARNIDVIVLDRPNPNGRYVDGPVLTSEYSSFIGMHPIPVLHGMTLGELAQMIVGERWLGIDASSYNNATLTVVPMEDYKRSAHYSLPVAPSPNLPNDLSIKLYPTLCFFEGTDVSIGRGTDFPFQLFGHPRVKLGETKVPVKANSAAPHPKHENSMLSAHVFVNADYTKANFTKSQSFSPGLSIREYSPITGLDITTLVNAYSRFSEYNTTVSNSDGSNETFFTRPEFFDKLAGTDALRIQIQAGMPPEKIRQSWQKELVEFREKRAAYLLYQDIE
tara:strand:+ start:8206 stop:9735 length:1530 start_codon:yes stop_codon:yes gene_type:complete